MSTSLNLSSLFQHSVLEHLTVVEALRAQQSTLERVGYEMIRCVMGGRKILWCGNGGSAADSQHLAAELLGRFRRERHPLPSIALTTDTSILTAIGNDYGYEYVFSRQVEALCTDGDILVGITTSGNSKNICLALETARHRGAFTVALTGANGGAVASLADAVLRVPSRDTARIQECHILCGHILCDWIELNVCQHGVSETVASGS